MGHIIANGIQNFYKAASSDTELPNWRIFLVTVPDRCYVLYVTFSSLCLNLLCVILCKMHLEGKHYLLWAGVEIFICIYQVVVVTSFIQV